MSSEDIILGLIKFVSETGRLPTTDESGLEDLINSAIKYFGSLENALRMAGLLTSNVKTTRTVRMRQLSSTRTPAQKSSPWLAYPKDYFLVLLSLKRTSHYDSLTPNGTPSWWERRANIQYVCSTCKRVIKKGERYIGRRELRPGKRGIYGYRGTYVTDYYHIVCLLRKAKAEIEKNIRDARAEINRIEKEIGDLAEEMSLKREQVEDCRTIMQRAREDYIQSGFWRKAGKWFGYHYTLWSKNREISRLGNGINHIENKEIPERETQIAGLKGRINNLEHQLREIDTRIEELVSRQLSDLLPAM